MRFTPLSGRASLLALAASLAAAAVGPARAAYTVTFSQAGPDVIATGGGADRRQRTDLLAFPGSTKRLSSPLPWPRRRRARRGATPASTAARSVGRAASALAPPTCLRPRARATWSAWQPAVQRGFIWVPQGYASGAPLSDTATYAGQTFASIGLTPGNYAYSFGFRARTRTRSRSTSSRPLRPRARQPGAARHRPARPRHGRAPPAKAA